MRENPTLDIVYRLNFSLNKATLGFIGSGKEAKQVECNMIGFETVGHLAREAFEEVHGKSELISSSTMRQEEFQAKDVRLILHPYWKLGILEVRIKR